MRLSKLEMQGFKSFAKKTELIISDGVTAVIGPNGSGKSNLSDAIRWVLGEQSARALRGNKMEDVIFNGTAVKRPLSMCSVSLSFENEDRRLPLDADEITVTRRAFRSGEGEYAINGKECRLKDILDLFRDTGIGKDGYSIISQGRVDEILSTKTQDRREAIEEAVGVTRFRVRREDTIKKLNQARRNMERLEDILNELRARLDPLREESEKAKLSLTLQETLKELEINDFIRETEKNNERITAGQQIVSECSEAENANRGEDETLRLQIEDCEEELCGYEKELSVAREEQYNTLSAYEKLQSAIQIENEHIHSAEEDAARLRKDLSDIQTKIETDSEILSVENDNISSGVDELKYVLKEAEEAYKDVCAKVESAESELEELKSSIMNNLNRLGQSRSDKFRLEAIRESLLKRQGAIKAETDLYSEKKTAFLKEHEDEADKYRKCRETAAQIEADLQRITAERSEAESKREVILCEMQKIDSELIAAQSNFRILSELVNKREGYQNSVRLLLNDAPKNQQLACSIVGVVAEMITVPKEYETAIGTALGASLQYIIAPTGDDAKYIIEHARRKQYGRITVLPLDILRKYDTDTRLKSYLAKPGVVGLASELIFCENKASAAIDFLLGRTLVVRDISCALSLRKEERCYLQIVTLEGDMLQSSGIISGGSKIRKSFDIISREREVTELEQNIRKIQLRKEKITENLKEAEERWQEAGALLFVRQNDAGDIRLEMERSKDRILIIEHDMKETEDRVHKLEEENESNCDSLEGIATQLTVLNNEEIQMRNNDSSEKQNIIGKQKAVQSLRAQRDQKLKDFTDAKIGLASAEKDELVKTREREKIRAEIEILRRQAASTGSMLQNSVDLEKEAADNRKRFNTEAEQISGSLDLIRVKIDFLQDSITEIKDATNRKRQRRDELLIDNRDILEKKSRAETSIAKLKTRQEQLADSIWQNYELTYENALPLRASSTIPNITEKIGALRKRIKEIGPVNPGSVEEYEEVSKRNEELSKQLLDIVQASNDLEDLIERLTKSMEKTFRDGFSRIQTEFGVVFSELFAGGKAELRLKEPADVLNSEIEIIAQPPGKKLQLLSLMSGGERALTAIALLFAMLRIKSPSFCVLDEIETSLDEENVNRFASFLKRYGEKTQFIVITHRKGSMEAANTIYGVSMEEKGISSIVSAKWEESA